jgi:hypothetical protein
MSYWLQHLIIIVLTPTLGIYQNVMYKIKTIILKCQCNITSAIEALSLYYQSNCWPFPFLEWRKLTLFHVTCSWISERLYGRSQARWVVHFSRVWKQEIFNVCKNHMQWWRHNTSIWRRSVNVNPSVYYVILFLQSTCTEILRDWYETWVSETLSVAYM